MTEDRERLFAGVLPVDDVDSGAIDLAGRFAELIDRLEQAVDALTAPKPIGDWAQAIALAVDSLAATREREAWQRAALQRVLDELVGEATVDGTVTTTPLALAEVRALLADRLQGRPTRANFRTGHLTVCTLHPMRSVPHRVVCLLGLDDGAFPRKAPRDGDDLMLDTPQLGERDPRTEDRQLLLDALLAATDRLIIAYTGNDERTNSPRPAAVPVGELLDVIDATARADHGLARTQVVVRHPLQPFDPRNFAPGALVPARTWSFDPVALDGARALSGPRTEPGPFLARPLPPLDAPLVELEDLLRFVQHPVRAFLRQRLRISARGRLRGDRGQPAGRARRAAAVGRGPAADRGAARRRRRTHGDAGRDRSRDAAARSAWPTGHHRRLPGCGRDRGARQTCWLPVAPAATRSMSARPSRTAGC